MSSASLDLSSYTSRTPCVLFLLVDWQHLLNWLSFPQELQFAPPSGTKTSRKRCVYNHGNSYLFRFTYTYMQITVYPRDFVGDKNVDFEFPDAFLFGHPFYFGYQDFYKLSFSFFIPTF